MMMCKDQFSVAFTVIWMSLFSASMLANQQVIQEVLDGSTVPKYVESVPTFNGKRVDGTKDLTVIPKEFQQKILPKSFYKALPDSVRYKSVETGKTVADINPRKGTYLWGYKISDGEKTFGPSYPANTIEVKRYKKTNVHYVNHLFPFHDCHGHSFKGPLLQKFLTVDLSLCWANPLNFPMYIQGVDTYDPSTSPQGTGLPFGNHGFYEGPQPMVVHLHGAETPSYSDGGPDMWFTPHKEFTGPSFVSNKNIYPNTQQATTLWFHDHVVGETRMNILAGQAGFYFIRGKPESLVSPHLPDCDQEIELAIADRQFDTNGQIFFPDGNPSGAGLNGDPGNPMLHPYAIPEFFGDVITVNGKSWPYLNVEPRRYRFRILDASNARMYALQLADEFGNPSVPKPTIWQIGSDGGLFDQPVNIDSFIPFTWQSAPTLPYGSQVFTSPRLFLSPAERMDVIIDFAGFEGSTFNLINDCPAPFPGGGTTLDPNVEGQVMQFRVVEKLSSPDTSFNPAVPGATLRVGKHKVVRLADGNGGLAPGVTPNLTRSLVLIEQEDPATGAPVTALLNNTNYNGLNNYTNQPLADSVAYNNGSVYITELPQVGSTEIWEIVNLTPDAHPIHIHLIQFQLMNRQVFNVGNVEPPFNVPGSYRATYEGAWPFPPLLPVPPGTIYSFGPPFPYLSTPNLGGNPDVTPFLVGSLIAPDPNEAYWKDTIKAFPGNVTRVVVRWAPQNVPVAKSRAGENLFPFDPTAKLGVKDDGFGYPGGGGYVWHCHIADHEDNNMMRPLALRNEAQR
jgi:spore coat protein A, manganese oxidase